ncbi:unnamed protein product [Schistocephalus solidus]|uniref:Uncharacterized protein n=1 Tax=Schistocephalus solidus TaxID=70667 RepID=A0A183T0V4_SCHSO|nr:unnamed protein product [Schistocephalus solidus]
MRVSGVVCVSTPGTSAPFLLLFRLSCPPCPSQLSSAKSNPLFPPTSPPPPPRSPLSSYLSSSLLLLLFPLPFSLSPHISLLPPWSKMSYGKGYMQSHNPRSNRPERRTALVARELARYKVDISALSETRFPEQGQLEEVGAGYTFFWIGRPKAEQRDAGVAFAIRNDVMAWLVTCESIVQRLVNQCLEHHHTAEIVASTALTFLAHSLIAWAYSVTCASMTAEFTAMPTTPIHHAHPPLLPFLPPLSPHYHELHPPSLYRFLLPTMRPQLQLTHRPGRSPAIPSHGGWRTSAWGSDIQSPRPPSLPLLLQHIYTPHRPNRSHAAP